MDNSDSFLINDVNFYLLLADDEISDAQMEKIRHLLKTNEEARNHYFRMINLEVLLRDLKGIDEESDSNPYAEVDFWRMLEHEEKTAPEIEIPPVPKESEWDEKPAEIKKVHPKVSKFSIYSLLLSSAALIFVIVYAQLISMRRGVEVATLTDSFNAKWVDVDGSMEIGTRVATNSDELCLREGLVNLLFDNNAKVVIEGPAKFKLITDDRIGLSYGKAYAIVPKQAVGFSIYTENAKVIDLGTEFGVEVNSQGDTYLNVVKGQTQLIATKNPEIMSMVVGQETAKMVNGNTSAVSSILYNDHRFVRSFDSSTKVIWRQRPSLDLADIVRNGNGLGTGNSQVRLNYKKGFTTDQRGGETLIAKDYLPIKDHPFIDGIFIPNGRTVVSSRGDVFADFLITSGVHCADLLANPVPGSFFVDGQPCTIQFDGQEYSERGKPCIVMNGSNHGITFDLDAIRSRYNLKIVQFTSRVGLVDFDSKRCNANFYVLVDGKERYSLLGYTQKGVLNDVSVKLEDTNRFLTLATSENVDQIDYMANSTLRENFCVFTEPVLVME